MATSSIMSTIWTEKKTLQHPFHNHPLTLRELSEDCEPWCSLCKQLFPGGPAYCCEDCFFNLHKACAEIELPPVIQEHPYHRLPGHPLNLFPEYEKYRCTVCRFSLDVLTAVATRLLPQDVEEVEEDEIHEHRMNSFRVETILQDNCPLCGQQILGQVHGCQSCSLMLHEVCHQMDLEIQHPLHRQHPLTFLKIGDHTEETFKCKACGGRAVNSYPTYCCKKCGFALHFGCTVSTMRSSSSTIEHYCHKHPLTPLHAEENYKYPILCGSCRLNISGFDAYACSDCSFFIHKSCADNLFKEILQHPFHPQHPSLVLRTEGYHGQCDSCSEDIASGAAFSCADCEFNLHQACALQPLSSIEEGEAACISHFSHEHPLRLALFGTIKWPYGICKVCHNYTGGVEYGCFTCQDFHLHRSCANLPQKLEHAFHPQHPLVLSKAAAEHFFCFACQDEHQSGMAFYCAKCQFYMGARCASLNATLKHPRHEHRLAYYKENTNSNKLRCSCCGKGCRYDLYCCMRCNFGLHRDCQDHLPPTIDHKCHWHPLQLCDKFVYGRPDDQYCDYCETVRNPDHGVYRCEQCNFSAHIECMISDYKEEENGSVTIGSEESNQLNIEIASVKADIETKRRDLKAMEANLEILLPALERIQDEVTIVNGKRCENFQSKVSYFPDKGLKNIFHGHPLNLRIISDNCKYAVCHLCKEIIHGPCYCCEACYFFLHGSCAVLEQPFEIHHPSHPYHPLTLLLRGNTADPYYCCKECVNFVYLPIVTAIATLPSQDNEELNEGADEDAGKRNMEEREGKDDEEEEAVMTVVAEEITRHFTHDDYQEEVLVAGIPQHFAQKEHPKEEEVAVMAMTSAAVLDEEIIRHFSHTEHPLVSLYVEMQISDICGLCRKPIFGQVYGCRECIFLLHASCVVSPSVIHHHPFGSGLTLAQCSNYVDEGNCIICDGYIGGGFVYNLQDGSGGSIFKLHMACALSTGFPRGHSYAYSSEFKVHPLHPCPLVFFHIEPGTFSPVQCKVCLLEISGEALGCPKCRFTLHKSCAGKLQEGLHHFLHPEHSLKLMQEPGHDYRCGSFPQSDYPRDSDINMVFGCDICEFYLHPYCAIRTLSAVEEGVAASISHFTHDHPLKLHFIRSFYCVVCEESIDGLAYCCPTCLDTNFHKSCAELPLELDHPYHPEHLLVLSKSPTGNFYCSVCHKKLRHNYDYRCAKCEFYLDVECAALKLVLKHPRHEHRLAYFESYIESGMPCNVCGKTCEIDLYVCVMCNFRLHYDCLPLPPEIKHEGHRLHTLFLKDKFVDGNPNYQYCDHCETLRNPEHGVYHCGECWFSAHIDCMIPKDKVKEQEKQPKLEPEESEVARMEEVIDSTRMNIDTTRGSLEALMEKLRELELEKESELFLKAKEQTQGIHKT